PGSPSPSPGSPSPSPGSPSPSPGSPSPGSPSPGSPSPEVSSPSPSPTPSAPSVASSPPQAGTERLVAMPIASRENQGMCLVMAAMICQNLAPVHVRFPSSGARSKPKVGTWSPARAQPRASGHLRLRIFARAPRRAQVLGQKVVGEADAQIKGPRPPHQDPGVAIVGPRE